VASHRADKRAIRRRSLPTSTTLAPSTILSVPALAGATALTLAAMGAATLSASQATSPPTSHDTSRDTSRATSQAISQPISQSGDSPRLAGTASSTDGSSSASRAALLAGRERAVSRDTRRTARQDAAARTLRTIAEKQARERNDTLARLAVSAERQARRIAADAWQLPVAAGAYHLTSRFGECSSLWSSCHTGLDFAAASGTPIVAVANGTITETGFAGAYGNRTIETLEDGTQIWYCHQTSFAAETGDRVTAGEVIGSVGSTGNTTGPHLHLEVRPAGTASDDDSTDTSDLADPESAAGDPVDPFTALSEHDLAP
jgi:murein DD-endopeptidase MepM/ murein hydrolase activator NlpD